jgi:hypothetical protein
MVLTQKVIDQNLARHREQPSSAIHLLSTCQHCRSHIGQSCIPLCDRHLVCQDSEARVSDAHDTKLISYSSLVAWCRINLSVSYTS